MIEESSIVCRREQDKTGLPWGPWGPFIKKAHVCLCTHAGGCVCVHTYFFIQQALSETFPYVRPWSEVDIAPVLNGLSCRRKTDTGRGNYSDGPEIEQGLPFYSPISLLDVTPPCVCLSMIVLCVCGYVLCVLMYLCIMGHMCTHL